MNSAIYGSPFVALGKLSLNFVINPHVFPFEAYVIKDLTHDAVLGRYFLQKYCFSIDFVRNAITFFYPVGPLPFPGAFGDII